MLLLMLVIGIVYGIHALKTKTHLNFLRQSLLLVLAGILALGLNAPPLLATAEYTQFSTRGKSELLRNLMEVSKKRPVDSAQITLLNSVMEFLKAKSFGAKNSGWRFLRRFGRGFRTLYFDPKWIATLSSQKLCFERSHLLGKSAHTRSPAMWGYRNFFGLFDFVFCQKSINKCLTLGIILSLLLSWGKTFPY